MSKRRRQVWLAIGWAEVIIWLVVAVIYAFLTRPTNSADFGMYYTAAETLRFSPHSDVYLLQTLNTTEIAHGGCGPVSNYPYLYPYQPLFALLLAPLTLMPCQGAAIVWFVLSFALWLGVAGVYAVQEWRKRRPIRVLVVTMMTVFFAPVMSGIYFGQIHIVLLACLVAGILLVERDHDFAGGAVLGFGAVLKYFPAFLVFYYLLRGRWRVAGSAAIVSIALVILEGLIVGPQRLLESISAGEYNVRLGATRFEGGGWMRSLPGGEFLAYVAATIFVVVVVWLRWGRHSRIVNDHLGAGWAIVTMLLISPLVWWFDLTWLIPTCMICLDVALRYARRPISTISKRDLAQRWWPLAVLAICYGLFMIAPSEVPTFIPNFQAMAAGTLLLWLLCGWLYLWSAGVHPPGGRALSRLWRRAQPGAVSSESVGVGAASR